MDTAIPLYAIHAGFLAYLPFSFFTQHKPWSFDNALFFIGIELPTKQSKLRTLSASALSSMRK